MVVSQHELPEYIMSDHDPYFYGHFWDRLISLLDTTLIFSMALHPYSDRMAEVMNHTIEQLLQIHAKKKMGGKNSTSSYAY